MSNNHYVDDKKLQQHLLEWQEARQENPDLRIPEEIGEAILKIATNYSRRYNWSNYTWRDEMVGDAIETCVKYIKNYDPWKFHKPLNYITFICMRAFQNRTKQEKKQNAKKYKYFIENVYDENDQDLVRQVDPEFMNDMLTKIDDFETSSAAPKKVREKAEARKEGLAKYYD